MCDQGYDVADLESCYMGCDFYYEELYAGGTNTPDTGDNTEGPGETPDTKDKMEGSGETPDTVDIIEAIDNTKKTPEESDCVAPHSVGQCGQCRTSDQCAEGSFCCPFMKKCVASSFDPCYYPIADCRPVCHDGHN
jgi:hypothetical protein